MDKTESIDRTNTKIMAADLSRPAGKMRITEAIVIAMDGSPSSMSTANIAIHLAQQIHLWIYGLYAADLMVLLDGYGDYHSELGTPREPKSEVEAMSMFEKQGRLALQSLRSLCDSANVPVKTELVFGGVPEMVLARAEKARILALGRRGYGEPAEKDHIGRNFQAILGQSLVPLLVGDDVMQPFKRILLIAYDDQAVEPALTWTVALHRAFQVEVTTADLLYGAHLTPQRLAEAGLEDYDFVKCRSETGPAIVDLANNQQAGMIILAGFRSLPPQESNREEVLYHLLRKSHLPILIA